MNEILIKEHEDKSIQVKINGNLHSLVDMLASAIMNDANFGAIILTSLAAIADKQNKFPDINPN